MRSTIIAAAPLVAVALAAGTVHADPIGQASGDCSSVTFTTPPATRMLFGIDSEPPVSIYDGASSTMTLFPYFTEHSWTFVVFDQAGTIIDRGVGHVGDCAALPYPADPGYDTIGSPVAGTPAAAPTVRDASTPTVEIIQEDDPRWDCATMGNRICGPGATRPNGEPIENPHVAELALRFGPF